MMTHTMAASAFDLLGGRSKTSRRPKAALALGWVAYALFYAITLGCVAAPVALMLRLLGVWPG